MQRNPTLVAQSLAANPLEQPLLENGATPDQIARSWWSDSIDKVSSVIGSVIGEGSQSS